MVQGSHTPSIAVTIGHHTRIYFALVTTAPTELDSPATITLHAATLSDVTIFVAEPLPHHDNHGRTSARLILVDAVELAWHRARCRGNQHLLLSVDPALVGLSTLQQWLWQRLQAPATRRRRVRGTATAA